MMILVVLRFGTAMAVIDEYLIFGGFNRASPTYTWTIFMYDQAFKLGLWRQGYAAAIGWLRLLLRMAHDLRAVTRAEYDVRRRQQKEATARGEPLRPGSIRRRGVPRHAAAGRPDDRGRHGDLQNGQSRAAAL